MRAKNNKTHETTTKFYIFSPSISLNLPLSKGTSKNGEIWQSDDEWQMFMGEKLLYVPFMFMAIGLFANTF